MVTSHYAEEIEKENDSLAFKCSAHVPVREPARFGDGPQSSDSGLQVPPQPKHNLSSVGRRITTEVSFFHQVPGVKAKALIGKDWDPGLKNGGSGGFLIKLGSPNPGLVPSLFPVERSSTSSVVQKTTPPHPGDDMLPPAIPHRYACRPQDSLSVRSQQRARTPGHCPDLSRPCESEMLLTL